MGLDDFENLGEFKDAGSAPVGRHVATAIEAEDVASSGSLGITGELPPGALPRHRDPHAIESISQVVPRPRHRAEKPANS